MAILTLLVSIAAVSPGLLTTGDKVSASVTEGMSAPRSPGGHTPIGVHVIPGDPLTLPAGVVARDGGASGTISKMVDGVHSESVIWSYGDTCSNEVYCGGYHNTYSKSVATIAHMVENLDETFYPTDPLIGPCNIIGSNLGCWPLGFSSQSDGSAAGFADLVLFDNGFHPRGTVVFQHSYDSEGRNFPVQVFDEFDCRWSNPFQGKDGSTAYLYLTASPHVPSQTSCPAPDPLDPGQVLFARVMVGEEADRSAYEFYDADAEEWTSDQTAATSNWSAPHGPLFSQTDYGSIKWNPYLERYLGIVGACAVSPFENVCGDEIMLYTAPSVEGPWNFWTSLDTLPKCDSVQSECGLGNYFFSLHDSTQSEDGRVVQLTFYNTASRRIQSRMLFLNPDAGFESQVVASMYKSQTGRDIDSQTMLSLTALMSSGASLKDIEASINDAAPLYVLHNIAVEIYNFVLGRSPVGSEPEEVLTSIISSGSWGGAVSELMGSGEFQAMNSAASSSCPKSSDIECFIHGLFVTALDRVPTTSEYAHFVSLDGSLSPSEMAALVMVGPSEWSDESLYRRASSVFENYYGRLPSPDERVIGAEFLSASPYGIPSSLERRFWYTPAGLEELAG